MHPKDEDEFAQFVLAESGVVFVHGSNWSTPQPPLVESRRELRDYAPLLIWASTETPPLVAERIEWRDGVFWNWTSEHLTIQFLRSDLFQRKILTEGRIAVATEPCSKQEARRLEERYRRLRKWLKARYRNSVMCWHPDKPDVSAWVGPHAIDWVKSGVGREFRQFREGSAAVLCDV